MLLLTIARHNTIPLHWPDLSHAMRTSKAWATMWRYHTWLPVRAKEQVLTRGEGMTPLLSVPQSALDGLGATTLVSLRAFVEDIFSVYGHLYYCSPDHCILLTNMLHYTMDT